MLLTGQDRTTTHYIILYILFCRHEDLASVVEINLLIFLSITSIIDKHWCNSHSHDVNNFCDLHSSFKVRNDYASRKDASTSSHPSTYTVDEGREAKGLSMLVRMVAQIDTKARTWNTLVHPNPIIIAWWGREKGWKKSEREIESVRGRVSERERQG